MTLLLLTIAFAIGVAFSFIPLARKLIQYFDTIVHEVGHGLATLPFGASLPKITLRSDFSGETRNSLGQIHGVLPGGIGMITSKIARFFSLMSGYSAPIMLGSFLITLSILDMRNEYLQVSEWVIISFILIGISTILWTLVAAVDSPIMFVVISVAIVFSGWFFFDLGWHSAWLILVSVVAFIIGKFVFSTLALISTLLSTVSMGMMFFGISWMFGSNSENVENFTDKLIINQSFDPGHIALLVLSIIGIVAFLSSRTLFSIAIVAISMILVIGSTVLSMVLDSTLIEVGAMIQDQQLMITPLLLTFIAGTLFSSGIKSFITLKKITFEKSNKFSFKISSTFSQPSQEETGTDVVFAADELGGSKEFWFIALIVFTVIVSAWLILFPLGIISF